MTPSTHIELPTETEVGRRALVETLVLDHARQKPRIQEVSVAPRKRIEHGTFQVFDDRDEPHEKWLEGDGHFPFAGFESLRS